MEENKTIAEVTPEVEAAPAVEETKKSVFNASVAPEEFDWDAFENDDVYGGSVADIAEQYNQTLSKVVEGEVVAVGPGTEAIKMEVKTGSQVIYSKFAGTEVKLDDEEFIIVKQSDILAIIE